MTYQQLINKLKSKEPFAFMRFGDGEIKCVLLPSENKANCDGHRYFPELSKKLIKVLDEQQENQTAIIGLQSLGDGIFPEFKNKWKINWVDSDIIHTQNEKFGLTELFKYAYNPILIGNPSMMKVMNNFDNWKMIPIPPKDAFLHYDYIIDRIHELKPKENTFLFCASMMSEPMIHELHKIYKDCTFIDVDSALDPYAGVISRTYHTRMGFNKNEMKNPRRL